MKTHVKPVEERKKACYTCICGEIFSPIENLSRHVENIHRCFLCGSMFETALFLDSHVKSKCFSIVGIIESKFNQKEKTITPEITKQLEDEFKCHSHSSPQFGVGLKNMQDIETSIE